MPTGRVKWFSDVKGYGFIVSDEGGPDVFVHFTGIADDSGYRSLKTDARVSFEVRKGRKGPEAFGVRPVVSPTSRGHTDERRRSHSWLPRRRTVR
jgi:CspA family cold shock protein